MNKDQIFKIEKKQITININHLINEKFVIKSSPYNYSVCFVDDEELNTVLSSNRLINEKKHFLFVEKVNKLSQCFVWTSHYIYPTLHFVHHIDR